MTLEDYNQYDEGEVVTISMSFVDTSGTPVSPANILLQLRDPVSREITEYIENQITEDAVGEWHRDIVTTGFSEGTWFYKVYASGDAQGAKEWAFIIKVSELT